MKIRCYDCGDVPTKDFHLREVLSEDGGVMLVPMHDECWKRATYGGEPVRPEKKKKPTSKLTKKEGK